MDKEAFGKLLTQLRGKKNMKQEELANILNVSKSAVSKWECGKNYPDFEMLKKISEVFDISCDDLLNPERTLAGPEPEKRASVSPLRRFLVPALTGCILLIFLITIVIIYRTLHILEDQLPQTAQQPPIEELATERLATERLATERPEIVQVADRYTQVQIFGKTTIYEAAFVCEQDLTKEEMKAFSEDVRTDWLLKEAKSPKTNIMRLSFYRSREDALSWLEPDSFLYISK